MDPKLLFWTAAILDLGAVCLVAVFGLRHARRGKIARHRRAMKIATLLVIAFLVSYVLKVQLVGREDMSVWTTADVWALRIHELFIMQMLIAGGVAWIQGRKLRATRLVTHDPDDPLPEAATVRLHRLAGRVSVIGALLGFLMAIEVLVGMYLRAFRA